MAAPAPAPVSYFVDPSGEVVELPAEQAASAHEFGYAPASPEQAEDFLRRDALAKQYGTDGQALVAGVEAAGRALTFGGSTVLERALGVDPEAIAAREELNPTAAGIGTAVGVAAPLLLTGGAAAPAELAVEGATGARAALAAGARLSAPSLASRAGVAVTEALGRGLPAAEGVAGQLARKAAAAGLGSAVEGAAYGVGEVVHEAALGDPNLTAQSALATIGLSAALGGGLGAGLGLAEAGLPVLARKARDTIAGAFKKGEGVLQDVYKAAEPVTGVSGDTASLMFEHKLTIEGLERQVPGIAEDISHATPEMVDWFAKNGTRLAEMEKAFPGTTRQLARTSPETANYLLDNWPKIFTDQNARNEVAKGLFDGGSQVIDTVNDLLRKANTEILPAEREELLGQIRYLADRQKVEEARVSILGRVESAVERMRAEPDLFAPSYARQLEVLRDGLTRDLVDGAPTNGWLDPATVFERLRTLKKSIGDATPFEKEGLSLSLAERNAAGVLKSLYGDVKQALVDETVFGAAAVRQSVLDDVQHEWISMMKPGGAFAKRFTEKVDGKRVLKTTKISTWLNQMADSRSGMLGDLRGREAAEVWGRMMDAAKRAVNEVEQSARTANVVVDFESVRSVIETAEAATSTAKERAAVTLAKAGLEGRTLLSSHPIVVPAAASVAQQAAGAVLPGAVSSVVRGSLSLAKQAVSVPRAVTVLATLERAGKAMARKIESASSTLVRGGVKAENVGRAEVLAGVARSFGHDDDRAATTYAKRAEQLRRLAQNSEALVDSLAAATDDLHDHAPMVAQALQATSARGVAFLASKLPQPPERGPLAPKWQSSRAEIARFERYALAVDNPIGVLKQASAGTLTPESVEAVRAVYPELYDRMRESIVEQIARHPEVPYRSRVMLSMLLGQDVDGSIAGAAANQRAISGPSSAPSQQAPGAAPGESRPLPSAGKVTLSSRMLTAQQRAAERD